jgi:hypothetical protein
MRRVNVSAREQQAEREYWQAQFNSARRSLRYTQKDRARKELGRARIHYYLAYCVLLDSNLERAVENLDKANRHVGIAARLCDWEKRGMEMLRPLCRLQKQIDDGYHDVRILGRTLGFPRIR